MKRKILVRRLGSDMNDEYHKETIDPQDELKYQTSNIDHPRQDQHDQKKTTAAERVHTQSTKSKQQEQIEATQIDTQATIPSPGPKPSLK